LNYLREGRLSGTWLTTNQDGSAGDSAFSYHAEDHTCSPSSVNLDKLGVSLPSLTEDSILSIKNAA